MKELQLGRKGSFLQCETVHPFPFHPAWIPSQGIFTPGRVRAALTPWLQLRAQAATLGLDPARAAVLLLGAQQCPNLQLSKLGMQGAVERHSEDCVHELLPPEPLLKPASSCQTCALLRLCRV